MPVSQMRFKLYRACVVTIGAWLLLTTSAPLLAQKAPDAADLSIEDLLNVKVYSASKHEQKTSEAPAWITVVSRGDIDKYGYRTLFDVLRNATGFYVRNHGTYSTLGVRGFAPPSGSNGRILLLVNGHEINDNINDSAPLNWEFPVDMDMIDRIEIVRGPSSALYGADAFFAVVNVITLNGNSGKGGLATADVGSLSSYKGTAGYGFSHRGTQALLSGTYYNTGAPGQLGLVEDPTSDGTDRDQARRLFALASSHGFTFQTAISSIEQHVPSSAQWCGSCHQTQTSATNYRGYADLQYQRVLPHDIEITARGYYDDTTYHGNYVQLHSCSEARCHGNPTDYDNAQGQWAGGELKFTKRFHDKDRLTVGTEYRDNFSQAQLNGMSFLTPAGSSSINFVNYGVTSHFWGIYGQGEFQLTSKLLLNAGIRTDLYNVWGDSTNPRIALIYTPKKTTTVKFITGSAFRAPSFSELYYAGMDSLAAPNLKPEKIWSYEGDWEQQVGKRMTLASAVYYNQINSYIEEMTMVKNGLSQTMLSNSSANAVGFECEARGRLYSAVQGRASYSYQHATNSSNGQWLPDSPHNVIQANVDAPFFRKLFNAGLEAQYMTQSRSLLSPTGYASIPVALNATLSTRELKGGFSFSASGYNLVGSSLSDPINPYDEQTHTVSSSSLLPEDRRSFRFKITWRSKGEATKNNAQAQPGTDGGQQNADTNPPAPTQEGR